MEKIIQKLLQFWRKVCQLKTWKLQHKSGGWDRDYFNVTIISLIGLFNLINQILKNQEMSALIYITLPFLVASFLIYNKHTSAMMKSVLFVLLAIGYQVAVPDASYIGSSVLFSLSFMQHNNIKYGISLSLITLIMIVIKATQVNHTPSQLIVGITAFIFIYGNVYLIIKEYKSRIADLQRQLKEKHKSKPVIRNIDIIKISEEEKAIIKLHCYGNTYEEISKILGLNVVPNTIRRKITAIMKDHNIKNDAHFGHWVFQKV